MKKFSLMIFCFAALLYVSFVSSENKTANSSNKQAFFAEDYLKTFYAKDFQALESFYTDRSVFEAPAGLWHTSAQALKAQGKEEVLSLLKTSLQHSPQSTLNLHEYYQSGDFTIVHGHLSVEKTVYAAGASSQTVKEQFPVTVILKIKDGKVLMHEEFKGKTYLK
jgi:ketosteroid isomerase-like protein